jgi:hypothetical protein
VIKILQSLLLVFILSFEVSAFENKLVLFDKTLDAYRIKNYVGENTIDRFEGPDGEILIIHKSENSASGLFDDIKIDLKKNNLNYLNFAWKVEKFQNVDETQKAYHDFPARVYLTFRTGPMPWEKYIINYVFSNTQVQGTHWKSPYLNIFTKSYDVALNGRSDPSYYWINHKIHIINDIQRLWNVDVSYLESIALMVDTDNTNNKVETQYKNIYLSQF